MSFNTLTQFYSSKEWRVLRRNLLVERVNQEDGILYCERCGEPILNTSEAVIHHKIALTLQNVNDYTISLNPDNLMIMSHRCHNLEHKRFEGQLSSWQRKVYCVFGAPCSGKSTFVRNNLQKGDLVLDLDSLWEAVSYNAAHNYPNELKPIVFGLRETLLGQIQRRVGKWGVAWVISTEALPTQRDYLLEKLSGEAIFIDTPMEECLARLHKEPNGRDLDLFEKLIKDYFEKEKIYNPR